MAINWVYSKLGNSSYFSFLLSNESKSFNKLCFQIRYKFGTIHTSLKNILRHILSLYCISNKDLSNMCNIAHVKTTISKKKLKNIFLIKKLYI